MLIAIAAVVIGVMSIAGYVSMAVDKRRAEKGEWRISELNLFLVAIFGGGIGSALGMYRHRHKTKHWYFQYGFPAFALCHVVIFGLLAAGIIG